MLQDSWFGSDVLQRNVHVPIRLLGCILDHVMTVSYSDYRLGTRLGRSKDQTRKNFALNTIACKISGYHRATSYQAQFNHAKSGHGSRTLPMTLPGGE